MTERAMFGPRDLPPSLPRSRMRRGPLVDLPLDNLRTGNNLFCVGWRDGKSWLLTSDQYINLVENLPSFPRQKKQKSRPLFDELESDKPEYDKFSSYLRRNRPDTLSDRDWVCGYAEPFNPSDWQSVPLTKPHPPQPAPEPFAGADKYTWLIGPGSWRHVAFIPSLKRKTAAKEEAKLAKFATEKKRLCAERKAQFKQWAGVLREALGSHANSHIGGQYDSENCPRCGASVFTKKRRVCLDCGYTLGELHYRSRTRDLTSYMDAQGMSPVQEITKTPNQRRRRHLTPKQFVAGLILRGQFEDLTNVASLEKASGTYQILCEGWLPRDVAAFSHDSERAIAARAERLFDTVTEHEAKGEPLPQPNFNEINHLKQHFAYVRNEIPSLRRPTCIN